MIKLATFAQALIVSAGLAFAPAAFAQTASTTAPAVAKPAEVKTTQQTAEAACAVHKKDSKEQKDCLDKNKAAAAKPATPAAKDPAKKS